MVEAIEDCFVPLLVYNNKDSDAALLKAFKEPSWNNPVVRFLDKNGKDLIARKDGVWNTEPLAQRMLSALKASSNEQPAYLSLIASANVKLKTASFAML